MERGRGRGEEGEGKREQCTQREVKKERKYAMDDGCSDISRQMPFLPDILDSTYGCVCECTCVRFIFVCWYIHT
jgi:hypothetical protein